MDSPLNQPPRSSHQRTPHRASGICLTLAAVGFCLSLLLWASSYVVPFSIYHRSLDGPHPVPNNPDGWNELHFTMYGVASFRGRLLLTRDHYTSAAPPEHDLLKEWAPERGWSANSLPLGQSSPPWLLWGNAQYFVLGAGFGKASVKGIDLHTVHLPFWLIMAVCAVPIALFLSPARRRARRRAQGLCPFCGYSRSDLPLETPCPECGKLQAG